MRRFWLRQLPCGSLRRPRRDRGIASSPYSLLGFSSHPFVPPPLRWGLEAAGRCALARRSAAVANGVGVDLRSSVALRLSWRLPCAADSCGSSLVAASGGQGGIGGLRVPPTPSLDSRVPLCTAAAPLGGWRRQGGAFWRGALPQGQGMGCCSEFFRCFATFVAASLRRYGPNKLPQVVSLAKSDA